MVLKYNQYVSGIWYCMGTHYGVPVPYCVLLYFHYLSGDTYYHLHGKSRCLRLPADIYHIDGFVALRKRSSYSNRSMFARRTANLLLVFSFILFSFCHSRILLATSAMSTFTKIAKAAESAFEVAAPVPVWPATGNPQILISGGAGYIGTHTIVCLLEGNRC